MKCYIHTEVSAVGLCKHCYKALCAECAIDTGYGLACSPTCAKEVEAIYSLIENNKKAYSSGPRASMFSPAFQMVAGSVFAIYGYHKSGFSNFAFVLGAVFVVFGISTFLYNRFYFKRVRTKYDA